MQKNDTDPVKLLYDQALKLNPADRLWLAFLIADNLKYALIRITEFQRLHDRIHELEQGRIP